MEKFDEGDFDAPVTRETMTELHPLATSDHEAQQFAVFLREEGVLMDYDVERDVWHDPVWRNDGSRLSHADIDDLRRDFSADYEGEID